MSALSNETVPYILSVLDYMVQKGIPATRACDECSFSYTTFDRLTTAIPELATARKEAEDRLYDLMAEALLDPDGHEIYGRTDPKMAAVLSKNLQWFLARRKQAKYGDKVTTEHIISADREVLQALQAAKARSQGAVLPAPDRGAGSGMGTSLVIETLVTDITGVMRPETPEEREAREFNELL